MLPRLEAASSLRHATEVAVGSGAMPTEDAMRIRRGWHQLTEPFQRTRKATAKDLSGLPIRVKYQPVRKEP
jgi:hypothetical protein